MYPLVSLVFLLSLSLVFCDAADPQSSPDISKPEPVASLSITLTENVEEGASPAAVPIMATAYVYPGEDIGIAAFRFAEEHTISLGLQVSVVLDIANKVRIESTV